jgi:ABC-type glycerol-3-phosphate transport system substrate-binding protein
MSKRWACLILLSLLFAGCAPTPTAVTSTATPEATAPVTVTPPAAVSPPASAPAALRVWLPPEFAPGEDTPGGTVFADQLAQFEAAHPGLGVEVRLKHASGEGGLLRSLETADNVAPAVLPDLIALDQDGLASAAKAGLVVPLDELIPADAVDDYYPFARAVSRVDGQLAGLPFAADARVLVYNTPLYPSPPRAWADVITGTLVFPGGELSALTVLHVYLSLGGTLADVSGKPALDSELLAEAFTVFRSAQDADVLPLSTLAYADPEATWQVFRERRATLAITSARWYLAERQRALFSGAALIPTSDGAPFALAEGWSWAVVNKAGDHRSAVDLLLWLTGPEQLSEWTLAAQVLPPRAAALAGWGDSSFAPFASDVLTHAQARPSGDVLAAVGPPLRQALDDVLSGRVSPFTAATTAAQAIQK